MSSTSNASLASAIKKRKAPVPPPALHEQVEASEKTAVNGSHDDSDRASSVSDQMSSVSDMSSPRKSATPEVVEHEAAVVIERAHQPSPGEQAEIQNWNLFLIELGQMLERDNHQRRHGLRVSSF